MIMNYVKNNSLKDTARIIFPKQQHFKHDGYFRCFSLPHFSTSTGSEYTPNDAATITKTGLLVNTKFHRPQPTLFFLPGLRSLPFWTAPTTSSASDNTNGRISVAYGDPIVTNIVNHLESNYKTIKDEYMSAVLGCGEQNDITQIKKKGFSLLEPDYDVNQKGAEHGPKLHSGSWDWHSYILNGKKQPKFEQACPNTVKILSELDQHLFSHSGDIPFAFCFFSTLHGNSFIKPHYGPMNLRLRIHLPLIVPSNTKPDAYSVKMTKCGIRVADQIREWKEGKVVVLDDSYEHEVWNETSDVRVLLLLDVWHPDVRMEERDSISKMFQFAQQQGWMGKKS